MEDVNNHDGQCSTVISREEDDSEPGHWDCNTGDELQHLWLVLEEEASDGGTIGLKRIR